MKSMIQNPPGSTVNPRDSRAAESCTYQVMGGTDVHNTDPKAIFKAENVTGGEGIRHLLKSHNTSEAPEPVPASHP